MSTTIEIDRVTIERAARALESAEQLVDSLELSHLMSTSARALYKAMQGSSPTGQAEVELLQWAAKHSLLALEEGASQRALHYLRVALRRPDAARSDALPLAVANA